MSALVEFDGVSKSFRLKGRPVQAVQDIGFAVQPGEAIGFVGPNGAGKSTSMKMLMGMLRPDQGRITLMGRPAADERARRGVGYVPENPYLYDYLTPLEVVSMGLGIHLGLRGAAAQARAMQWLERMGIGYAAHKRVRNLSKGMTQRTALAHALALEPRLLVLDEPMSGLDPVGRKLVADEVNAYRQRGGTLFFCSHILNDVERLASRILLIHQGRLRADTPMTELLTHGDMVVRYSGERPLEGFVASGPGIWQAQVGKSQVPQLLDGIAQAGGELVDVQRVFTLEEWFARIVQGAGQPDAAHG
ncbi:ABC transporter ATP-binding protein [Vandammella animalimorsus]|uniref:ABC transporter ATP-binding protein n=1 Tax=Vandammella animalimorsus TaxID=2029117 RepID=A0A2A2AGP2_9BURK|nr:ABC transporter ATP-binding protein [Vandammella animalimorsus]PAT37740.1 ABC transporter ATP-binding protein [Vandammella animalimorsus]